MTLSYLSEFIHLPEVMGRLGDPPNLTVDKSKLASAEGIESFSPLAPACVSNPSSTPASTCGIGRAQESKSSYKVSICQAGNVAQC